VHRPVLDVEIANSGSAEGFAYGYEVVGSIRD